MQGQSPKILIIHDRFQFRGGAERLVLILAKALHADVMTEFWTQETYTKSEVWGKCIILDSGEPPQIVWRYFRAQLNFLFKARKFLGEYDCIIFSGNNCLTAAWNLLFARKKIAKIMYCHTPVRHVYDLWELNRSQQNQWWKRLVYYDIGRWGIRAVYRLGLACMDRVLANSQNVQRRLARYCHTASTVVYPPIMTQKFRWISQGEYYLSYARLDELKRIDDIVRAFQRLPDKKLVIASGGSELGRIQELARGYANISVLGWVENDTLFDLVGNACATVYIPIDEDFGMTNVESLAAGKPVIAVRDGGLVETMQDEIHAKFIPKNYTIDDLVAAIEWMTPERALRMRAACEHQARQFDESVFISRMRDVVAQATQGK